MLLKEGDIIVLKKGHRVYSDVPSHFLYTNRVGCWDIEHGLILIGGAFSYLEGEYIVYKTTCDGGGTGHGPYDVFPDGHHVFCQKIVGKFDSPIRVDFYQDGCFTAMITDIEPIGKATCTWTKE